MAERDLDQKSVDPQQERAPTPIGHGLAIRRFGSSVQITITAGNEYLAIELFDRLTRSAQEGSLRLDINATAESTSASVQR